MEISSWRSIDKGRFLAHPPTEFLQFYEFLLIESLWNASRFDYFRSLSGLNMSLQAD